MMARRMVNMSMRCRLTCCPDRMAAALDITDLSVTRRDGARMFSLVVPALKLEQGRVLALTGSSGTGKTILLEVLGLLRRPSPGGRYVLCRDDEIMDMSQVWERGQAPLTRGRSFGFVPQSGGLLPFLTVLENITLSQRIAGTPDADWVSVLMDRLEIGDLAMLTPGVLSIGQRQRVAIARALAHRPTFVLADEPTAALDPDAAENAMRLLIETASDGGAGVVISSHELALLDRFDLPRRTLAAAAHPDGPGVVSTLITAEAVAA